MGPIQIISLVWGPRCSLSMGPKGLATPSSSFLTEIGRNRVTKPACVAGERDRLCEYTEHRLQLLLQVAGAAVVWTPRYFSLLSPQPSECGLR